MEIIVSLGKFDNLEKINKSVCEGLLYGGKFSLNFNYDNDQIQAISAYLAKRGLKSYIVMDAFIKEDQRVDLYDYLEFLKSLNPDGIYFTDLGVISAAKAVGIADKLIYDGGPLMTNALDASFYLEQGFGVVLARELCLDEIMALVKKLPYKLDMQVFGHLKMSYSKRKFLTNYFKEINKDINITGDKDIRLIEENREYALPIIEDRYGTRIYTDYVLLMYEELAYLRDYLKRLIVDDIFLEDTGIIYDVCRDIHHLNRENYSFLRDSLISKYADVNFSSGYLYQKTSKVKEDE